MIVSEGDAMAVGLDEAPAKVERKAKRRQEMRANTEVFRSFTTAENVDGGFDNTVVAIDGDGNQNGHWQPYFERACANIDRGQYHLAVALLERVIRQAEGHVEAWHRLGFAYGELGRTDRAVACFDHVIQLQPNRSEAWTNRAWNRLRRHDTSGAIADLLQAVEIDHESANAWSALGAAYVQIRSFAKAVEAFERACQASPQNETYCFSLATCLARIGDKKGAIRWFCKACEINPMYFRAWFELLTRTWNPRDWPQKHAVGVTLVSTNQSLPNIGRIVRREGPTAAIREAKAQDRVNRLWALVQNPVTWIVVFIIAGLIYTLLGT